MTHHRHKLADKGDPIPRYNRLFGPSSSCYLLGGHRRATDAETIEPVSESRDRKINMRTCGEETMDDPISPARRTLLKAGAVALATPVAAAIAQPAAVPGHQEAKTFDLWVISDQHVGTDKAASEGILHGMVGFRPR